MDELREKIKDYYGSAMSMYPVAMEDMENVDNMTDKEVIDLARKLHII